MNITIPYDEFRASKQLIAPKLTNLNDTAKEIIEYALIKILNNAQDHSGGNNVSISISQDKHDLSVTISDDGVGIFKHIMEHLHLDQALDAAIELSKGKLTTQPERHSGEGLFFTLQAVDRLTICANAHCLELTDSQVTFNVTEDIGQGFADEMFRVWQSFHKETIIKATYANEKVKKLISRVTGKNQ